jgi:hypothetical protein
MTNLDYSDVSENLMEKEHHNGLITEEKEDYTYKKYLKFIYRFFFTGYKVNEKSNKSICYLYRSIRGISIYNPDTDKDQDEDKMS